MLNLRPIRNASEARGEELKKTRFLTPDEQWKQWAEEAEPETAR